VPTTGVTSEVSARIPPSPRLSAFSTKTAYFTEMTSSSAQKISDSTPSTFSRVGCMWLAECMNDSRTA
jgi:hypothetical protein